MSPSERSQFEALARANRGNALAQNPETAPGRTSDWSLWAIGFGNTGHLDADGLMPKVDTSGAGVVVGLTHRADTWTAGVHYIFNASWDSTDLWRRSTNFHAGGVHGAIALPFPSLGQPYLSGEFTIGGYNTEADGFALVTGHPRTGTAKFGGYSTSLRLQAGTLLRWGRIGLDPHAIFSFAYTTRDDFTTSTPNGDFDFDRTQLTSVRLGGGVRAVYVMPLSGGMGLRFTGRLGYEVELGQRRTTINAVGINGIAQGVGFVNTLNDRGKHFANVGAGAALIVSPNLVFALGYNGTFSGASTNHTFQGGVSYRW